MCAPKMQSLVNFGGRGSCCQIGYSASAGAVSPRKRPQHLDKIDDLGTEMSFVVLFHYFREQQKCKPLYADLGTVLNLRTTSSQKCEGSKEGSYFRLIDMCITQFQARIKGRRTRPSSRANYCAPCTWLLGMWWI